MNRSLIQERVEKSKRRERLVEQAFALYEQGETDIEGSFSEEELHELWSGLKHLASKGAQALGNAGKNAGRSIANTANKAMDKVDQFAGKVGDKVYNAASSVANTAKGAADQVGKAARTAQDSVVDTYRQGEVNGIVQKIHALNKQYKELTGKSFVRQFSAAAKPVNNATRRAASQGQGAAVPQGQTRMAMAEVARMQKLAGIKLS